MSARSLTESRQLSTVDVRLGLELVHHAARLLHRERDQPLLRVPVLLEELRVLRLELVEPTLLLERDLELGEVEVLA